MTSRYRRKPVHIPRFSSLEIAVMQALAWELRSTVPDLDVQFDQASPGCHANTVSGFHREILADRNRKPRETATGLFGTVHALIDGLEDAVLFQAQLRDGRIVALVADAYDQDTRHIDFLTTGYEQVFYLDAYGVSRLFDSSVLVSARRSSRTDERRDPAAASPAVFRYTPPESQRPVSRPVQRPADRAADSLRAGLKTVARSAGVPTATPEPAGKPMDMDTVRVGVWVSVVAIALIAFALGAPLFFMVFGTVFLGRALTQPPALRTIAGVLADRRWRPD